MSQGTLQELLSAGTIRVVLHFLVHPEEGLHFNALRARTGLGNGALQRELARLVKMGLLERVERAGLVVYQPVPGHRSWLAIRTLVQQHAAPADVLREALRDVEGIRAAFVFGSAARGETRPDSDVDLLVVEEGVTLAAIGRALLAAESVLGRRVEVRRYAPTALACKLEAGNAFLREVLAGPKQWIVGSEATLNLD